MGFGHDWATGRTIIMAPTAQEAGWEYCGAAPKAAWSRRVGEAGGGRRSPRCRRRTMRTLFYDAVSSSAMRNLAVLAVLALLGAGCAGNEDTHEHMTHTCADGTVVDLSTVDGHDEVGFDAERDACTPATPLRVVLDSAPMTLRAYETGSVMWSLDPGSHTGAHSMLNVVRMSNTSVSDAALVGLSAPDGYGSVELGKMEHQNLPAGPFNASFSVKEPGVYYIRALARIYADGVEESVYVSSEHILNVTAVALTTDIATVTHAAGNSVGGLDTTTLARKLGDGVIFKNDDVTDHTFTWASQPQGSELEDVVVARLASSAPIHFLVPGTYTVTTDDVQPVTLTINVTLS